MPDERWYFMRLKIDKEKRVLLLHSEITKKPNWFFELLAQNERITEKLVSSLPPEHQSFIQHILPEVERQAIKEWERDMSQPVLDMGPECIPECRAKWLNCSLSGTPNRHIFYIVNKLNGNKLNVGSECVNDFVDKKERKDLEKDATKIFFLSHLNEKFPGIKDIVREWNSTLDRYPLMIPRHLEEPYLDLGASVLEVYERFINEQQKVDYAHYGIISKYLQERNVLLQQIEQYMQDNIGSENVPTREIELWLIKQRTKEADEGLRHLKDTGRISVFSAHRIREFNYMKSLMPKLNELLGTIGVVVSDVSRDKESYVLRPLPRERATLYCKHKQVLEQYGGIIYGNEQINPELQEIIEMGSVEDEETIYFIERKLRSILRKYSQEIIDSNFEFDEIILKQDSGRYIIDKLKAFVVKFKHLAFGSGKQNNKELIDYIESYAPSYALSYMKDMEIPRWKYGM